LLDLLEQLGAVSEKEIPAVSPDLLATAVAHEGHAAGPRVDGEPTASDD
jgi:thioredoxin reductase (NADPH)